MPAFSNYMEEKIIDHFLRDNSVASPSQVFLALFESDPTEAGSGTETSYQNYARQAASWTAIDINGQTKNASAVTFPANANAAASVDITHAAIFDAATGGNMLLYGPLAAAKQLDVGDVLSFQANALALTID